MQEIEEKKSKKLISFFKRISLITELRRLLLLLVEIGESGNENLFFWCSLHPGANRREMFSSNNATNNNDHDLHPQSSPPTKNRLSRFPFQHNVPFPFLCAKGEKLERLLLEATSAAAGEILFLSCVCCCSCSSICRLRISLLQS